MKSFFLSIFFMLFYLFSQGQINKGDGTYYAPIDGTNSGNCSIFIDKGDYMYCALNAIDYNNAAYCGAYIKVTGVKGSVILQVVDSCPECLKGDVDMTEQAFSKIDDVINGRVDITWEFVDNPNDTTVKMEFKEGSTQYWTAIKLFDIKEALQSLEYLNTAGNWVAMERMSYNFFVEPNGIMSPMTLRATSIKNDVLIFDDVTLAVGPTIDTQKQFGDQALSVSNFKSEKNNIILHPNPVTSLINISGITNQKWVLYNTKLQEVNQGVAHKIDVSNFASGVYYLKIEHENQFYKIIKL